MTWLSRVIDRLLGRPSSVGAPAEHRQHTLERADAYLEHPEIKALLSKRDRDMRASMIRANRRLGR